MKHIRTVAVFATMFVLGIVPTARAGGEELCSDASLHGSFGYTSTGTILPAFLPPPFAGPFGEIGRQSFDGKGNTQATATLSANGNISQAVIIEGTYSVTAGCTGSMTLNIVSFGVTVHADFVIDQDGTEIRAIGTDNGLVESRVYRKQFPGDHGDSARQGQGARELLPSFPAHGPVELCSSFQRRLARQCSLRSRANCRSRYRAQKWTLFG